MNRVIRTFGGNEKPKPKTRYVVVVYGFSGFATATYDCHTLVGAYWRALLEKYFYMFDKAEIIDTRASKDQA